MPEPPSAAVPVSVTRPPSGVPGLVRPADVGAALSIRVLTVAEVVARPAPSVAIARASTIPSGTAAVLTGTERGGVRRAGVDPDAGAAGRIWSGPT